MSQDASGFTSSSAGSVSTDKWSKYTKIAFRFAFIYFFIQSVPLDWKFYRDLFSINWFHLHFYELLVLSRYSPQFFGLTGFANWLVVIVIAAIGAAIWTYNDRDQAKEYTGLYYWLRVIIRYRLAVGVISYGFIKLFPLQMPYPSLSSLHTNYGEFLPWKIYFNTIGVTSWYESFLGSVEIVAGILLLNRRTATFGAGIIVGFIGNVLAANFAYNIGEQVYSTYLFALAVFLLAYDTPRLYRLLIEQRFTIADKFIPSFTTDWLRKTRIALKSAFVLFILLFGYKTYSNYKHDPYLLPKTPGLADSYGFYNVKEFKLNNRSIPYSLTDTNRWQNVVFEKWATLSIKIAGPIQLDLSNGNGIHQEDIDKNYEEAGVGDRRYFGYTTDTLNHTLSLQNKNSNYKDDQLLLHYSHPDSSTIILTGVNENKDSIYVELDKVVKKYMLFEGRRKPLKL
ncbi:MAG TPA: hypothetical protein VK718_10455 [Ferruginibacter sp.]|nr:hypothetical protein [Ferruginibacter sp.]